MNHDDFLQAILDDPDDDAPRLIYADWLEERGDPRGEFIRVQCELAPLGPTDPRRPELETRETALLAKHRIRFVRPIPQGVVWCCTFRRGFLDCAELAAADFLRHAAVLFRAAPVRGV